MSRRLENDVKCGIWILESIYLDCCAPERLRRFVGMSRYSKHADSVTVCFAAKLSASLLRKGRANLAASLLDFTRLRKAMLWSLELHHSFNEHYSMKLTTVSFYC